MSPSQDGGPANDDVGGDDEVGTAAPFRPDFARQPSGKAPSRASGSVATPPPATTTTATRGGGRTTTSPPFYSPGSGRHSAVRSKATTATERTTAGREEERDRATTACSSVPFSIKNSKSNNTGRCDPTNGARKRSRKEVLASISSGVINCGKKRKQKIKAVAPIPSFKSDSELSRLERAFFDEVDGDGDDLNGGGNPKGGGDVAETGGQGGTLQQGKNDNMTPATTKKETGGDGFATLALSSDGEGEDSDGENLFSTTRRAFPDRKSFSAGTGTDPMTAGAESGEKSAALRQREHQGKPHAKARKRRSTPCEEEDTLREVSDSISSSTSKKSALGSSTDGDGSTVSTHPHGNMSAQLQETRDAKSTEGGERDGHDTANDVADNVLVEFDVGPERQPRVEQPPSEQSREAKSNAVSDKGCSEALIPTPAVEPAVVGADLGQPLSNEATERQRRSDLSLLEIEVDRLFLKSDLAAVTMNGFCKALERQMCTQLGRETARLVKKRVYDLINGVVLPRPTLADLPAGHSDATAEGEPPTGTGIPTGGDSAPWSAPEGGEKAPRQDLPPQNHQGTAAAATTGGGNRSDDKSVGSSPSEDQKREASSWSVANKPDAEPTSVVAKSGVETGRPDAKNSSHECEGQATESGIQSSAPKAANVPLQRSDSTKAKKWPRKGNILGSNGVPNMLAALVDAATTNEHVEPERAQRDPKPPAIRGRQSQVQAKACEDQTTKDLTSNHATSSTARFEPDPAKPEPRPRAKRRRPVQVPAGVRDDQSMEVTVNNHEPPSAAPAGTTRTQKRARKIACALCKTCPCQKAHSCDSVTTLDMKESFARSDSAVEKALIRRMQKLEKSAECLQEQTEFVRRNLKKHRRDVWKRNERESSLQGQRTSMFMSTEGGASDSWFLPDAEVFDRQQMESQSFNQEVVYAATARVFDNPTMHQPTLTQMMGLSKKRNEKTNPCIAADQPLNDEVQDERCLGLGVIDENQPLSDAEDINDVPTEYVPESSTVENEVTRVIWKPESHKQREGRKEPTIWDSFPMLTQDVLDRPVAASESVYNSVTNSNLNDNGRSASSWDELFRSKEEIRDEGLDDLLDLFKDNQEASDQGAINRQEVRSDIHDDSTSLAMLSPGAKRIASEIIANISAKDVNVKEIEQSCPNWKENVTFALRQKDPDGIQDALHSVKESRERMQTIKERILQAWERQNMTLEVFEAALEASAARLTAGSNVHLTQDGDGGFLTHVDDDACGILINAVEGDAICRGPVDVCFASH